MSCRCEKLHFFVSCDILRLGLCISQKLMAKKKPAPPERLIPFLTQKQIKQLVKILEARKKKERAIQRAIQRATGYAADFGPMPSLMSRSTKACSNSWANALSFSGSFSWDASSVISCQVRGRFPSSINPSSEEGWLA